MSWWREEPISSARRCWRSVGLRNLAPRVLGERSTITATLIAAGRCQSGWPAAAQKQINAPKPNHFELAGRWGLRRIARTIVRARPIRDTEHLATVVAGVRKVRGRQKLHPATKTFLALRIAVNREMEELGQFLSRVPATLSPGGRWVMLSYHSLEDRPVKQCFQRLAQEGTLNILTRKVIQASDAEIAANPRARSVKMRVGEKIDPDQHGIL